MNEFARDIDSGEDPQELRRMKLENELMALGEPRLRANLEKFSPDEVEALQSLTLGELAEILAEKMLSGEMPKDSKDAATKQGIANQEVYAKGAAARQRKKGGASPENHPHARAKVQKGMGGSAAA